VLRGHRESVPPECYLRETAATDADAALTLLARAAEGRDGPLAAAHALAAAVADAIAYRPGVTAAHTTAAEALALGEGVCQDHAHALIACARVAGLPARYVSGYLFADAAGVPHEAAHAWAEIFVAGLGWVGFDPANRCCPDDRYIRLGSGFDAQDAAPIRGVARGAGAESLDVSVAVQMLQQ
jgi:transglutaminase-like putative cysteine protease